jgi:hypothetical protein
MPNKARIGGCPDGRPYQRGSKSGKNGFFTYQVLFGQAIVIAHQTKRQHRVFIFVMVRGVSHHFLYKPGKLPQAVVQFALVPCV